MKLTYIIKGFFNSFPEISVMKVFTINILVGEQEDVSQVQLVESTPSSHQINNLPSPSDTQSSEEKKPKGQLRSALSPILVEVRIY